MGKPAEEVLKRIEGHFIDEEYLGVRGLRCPKCKDLHGALRIVRGDNDRSTTIFGNNATKVRRLIICDSCKFKYWDNYQLVGYTEYTPGDESREEF
jgi:hypothetical protein